MPADISGTLSFRGMHRRMTTQRDSMKTMKRILIIEDNAEERELFALLLRQAGYDVAEAPDGEAGVERCRETAYDAIVCDIYMPKKEGLETMFELRQEFPELKIVAITGGMTWVHHSEASETDNILQIARAVGANAVLTKPVGNQTLLETVKELLRDSKD